MAIEPEYEEFWATQPFIGNYDWSNKPHIKKNKFDEYYEFSMKDFVDDYGDCIHVKHPKTGEEFRIYYEIIKDKKVLDGGSAIWQG